MPTDGGDKEEIGYKTFLGHLYDLLEDKINTERYEEGVRQLVGNQVRFPRRIVLGAESIDV